MIYKKSFSLLSETNRHRSPCSLRIVRSFIISQIAFLVNQTAAPLRRFFAFRAGARGGRQGVRLFLFGATELLNASASSQARNHFAPGKIRDVAEATKNRTVVNLMTVCIQGSKARIRIPTFPAQPRQRLIKHSPAALIQCKALRRARRERHRPAAGIPLKACAALPNVPRRFILPGRCRAAFSLCTFFIR